MALTKEQIAEVKSQLSQQIAHLPAEQKEQAQAQIDSLSDEALESLVKQSSAQSSDKNIFRMIIDKEVPSIKLDESASAIAVLDINPISKGHTMIIPKKPVKLASKIPSTCFTLAKKISKKITSKLKAKSTEIQSEEKFGEAILHIIPIYDKPLTLESPRSQEKKEYLEDLAKTILKEKKKPIKIKTQKSETIRLKRRVP